MEFLQLAAQYGLPTVLLFVLIWRHREDMHECRNDRNRLWQEMVRLAEKLPPGGGPFFPPRAYRPDE